MDAQAAAQLGDDIAHGYGLAAMIAGAVAGAIIGAAVVAATAANGGLAAVILAGSIAAGGVSMFQVVKGLTTLFDLPEPATGALIRGSPNVFINLRNAMRAGEDVSTSCSGFPAGHPYWPSPVTIAEGSATVYLNGKPAALPDQQNGLRCAYQIGQSEHLYRWPEAARGIRAGYRRLGTHRSVWTLPTISTMCSASTLNVILAA